MAADSLPVAAGVLRDQRRSLLLWGVAVAAVTAVYVGFWPAMGEGAEIEAFVENMPEALVQALGYDQIATPAGYLRSTVYGLLARCCCLCSRSGPARAWSWARRRTARWSSVVSFVCDAVGPAVGADWMTAVSPFSWYLEPNPLTEGFQLAGLALLAAVTLLAAVAGFAAFDRRDLMV